VRINYAKFPGDTVCYARDLLLTENALVHLTIGIDIRSDNSYLRGSSWQ